MSCKATKNILALPKFFNATEGLKFVRFQEGLISAPPSWPGFFVALVGINPKNKIGNK